MDQLTDQPLAEHLRTLDLIQEEHDHQPKFFKANYELHAPRLLAIAQALREENTDLATELGDREEKARKRWIKRQEKQLGIRFADFRNGRWEMDLAMGREMAAAYVAMAKTMLGDGPNYSETKLEFDVKIAESPEMYTLVVQRHAPGALTPHEARLRAEAELDRLRAELATAREQIRDTTVSLETLHDQLVFENPDAGDALQAITDRLNRADSQES